MTKLVKMYAAGCIFSTGFFLKNPRSNPKIIKPKPVNTDAFVITYDALVLTPTRLKEILGIINARKNKTTPKKIKFVRFISKTPQGLLARGEAR
jgi:hypothetical protein